MSKHQFVEVRLVQDPAITDAEYFHQRQTKSGPYVGKVGVTINMLELVGGLARIRDRTELQEAAAAKYRLLHERSQIGGARAVDYAAVKVDTSGPSDSASAEIGEDARRQYKDAVQYLGMTRSSLVERIVVYDQSVSAVAGKGARARMTATRDLLDALEDLAVHFKFATSHKMTERYASAL